MLRHVGICTLLLLLAVSELGKKSTEAVEFSRFDCLFTSRRTFYFCVFYPYFPETKHKTLEEKDTLEIYNR